MGRYKIDADVLPQTAQDSDLVAPSSDSFRALRLARSLNDHLLALPLADENERMTRLLDQSYGCYIYRNCCDIDRRHSVYREGS